MNNNIVEFHIFYNRDNDMPWAIRIKGKRKWVLCDVVDLYRVSLITVNSSRQPKAFLAGRGRIFKISGNKVNDVVRYVIQGE